MLTDRRCHEGGQDHTAGPNLRSRLSPARKLLDAISTLVGMSSITDHRRPGSQRMQAALGKRRPAPDGDDIASAWGPKSATPPLYDRAQRDLPPGRRVYPPMARRYRLPSSWLPPS